MKKKRMMDIHVDALAYAAGVRTMDNLAVSHPPYYPKRSKRWLRRLLSWALRKVAHAIARLASFLDSSDQASALARSDNKLRCCT